MQFLKGAYNNNAIKSVLNIAHSLLTDCLNVYTHTPNKNTKLKNVIVGPELDIKSSFIGDENDITLINK